MNKRIDWHIKVKTLFLLAVFLFASVVKPIHILFEHSHIEKITAFHTGEEQFVPDQHFDCEICAFEFCTFLPEKKTELPAVSVRICADVVSLPQACLSQGTEFNIRLRAPPAA